MSVYRQSSDELQALLDHHRFVHSGELATGHWTVWKLGSQVIHVPTATHPGRNQQQVWQRVRQELRRAVRAAGLEEIVMKQAPANQSPAAVKPAAPQKLTLEQVPELLTEAAILLSDEAGRSKVDREKVESLERALLEAKAHAKDLLLGQQTIGADNKALREKLQLADTKIAQLQAEVLKAPGLARPNQIEVDRVFEENKKLKEEQRAHGKFCPHCGRDRTTGLRPGE